MDADRERVVAAGMALGGEGMGTLVLASTAVVTAVVGALVQDQALAMAALWVRAASAASEALIAVQRSRMERLC